MDFAKMRGELERVVDGDEDKLRSLAFDLRSLLKARMAHMDLDDRATMILEDWSLDWAWMKPWLDLFDQACHDGSDEQLADWLADGAPEGEGQTIALPDSQTAAAS